MAQEGEPSNIYPVTKTGVENEPNNDTHLLTKTEVEKKPYEETHPVTKSGVGKEPDDVTHPVTKTAIRKEPDGDTHLVTKSGVKKETDDETHPVTKTEKEKKPDDETHPVMKTEVGKKPDDETHLITKTEGGKKPDDETHPVTKTEGETKPDDETHPVMKTEVRRKPDDETHPITKTEGVKKPDDETHLITKTEGGKKPDDETHPVTKTEEETKPDDETHPVMKTGVGRKSDDETHPITKTEGGKKLDDETHLIAETDGGKKPDDETHPVTKTEGEKKPDDETHPVLKTEVGKKPDDETHPITKTESGKKPDVEIHPVTKTDGEKKPDDETHPETKIEVEKKPGDETHPVTKTGVGNKRYDETHPETETEGEKKPDDETHLVTKTEIEKQLYDNTNSLTKTEEEKKPDNDTQSVVLTTRVGKESNDDTHTFTKTGKKPDADTKSVVGKVSNDSTFPVRKTEVEKKPNDDTYSVTKTEVEKESNNAQELNNDLGILESDEVIERYCEPCRIELITEKATRFCYTCLDYICCTCLRYHNRYLPDHQHVNIDDIPPDISLEHNCSVHKNEMIKFFCSSCNSLLCNDCKLKTHQGKRTCVIKCLVEYVDKVDVDAELNKVILDTQNIIKKLSKTEETIETKHRNLIDSVCRITKETEAIYTKFVRELHAFEEKVSKETVSESERIKDLKERSESVLSKVYALSADYKQLSLSAKYRKCRLFIGLRRINLEAGTLDSTIDDIGKQCTQIPNDLANTVLIQALNGMLENIETKVLRTKDLGYRQTTETRSRKVAKPIADINVKASCDTKDCNIMDCCILGQQYLVACDRNNRSVKLLDLESQSLVYVRSVKTHPEAVTKINDSVIALARRISLGEDDGVIEFLTLKQQSRTLIFQKRTAIKTETYCTNMVFYQNSLIVSMHQNDNIGKIQILSMSGQILFCLEENAEGNEYFNFPDYLAIDPIRERFYVSDRSGTITQIQCDDLEISETMNAWYPKGITVDDEGLVYVCEKSATGIRAVDFDSYSSYDLIENGSPTSNSQSVCFNKLDSKLYVGESYSDYMRVYKIEKKDFVRCHVFKKVEEWLPK